MSLNNQKILYGLWKEFYLEFSNNKIVFRFDEKIDQSIKAIGGKSENIRAKEIHLDIYSLSFNVFPTIEEFLKLSVDDLEKDTLILNSQNFPLSQVQKQIYKDFHSLNGNYFFSNAIAYSNFIEYLEDLDQDQENAFHFIDSVDTTNRRMVFTSPTEKGRLVIHYINTIPYLDETIDYNIPFQKFLKCFKDEQGHLPKFLKAAVIDQSLHSSKSERMSNLFMNLDDIVDMAYLNFEIYLNNLSIDQVRRDYDDFKSKYFKEVSEILKNVTQKIIGLPVVVASTLFAMDKVKDNDAFLIILLITVVITSAYLTVLLRINFKDIKYVSILSEKDFDELRNNKFFIKYPKELDSFGCIKQRITSRIGNLKLICESYFWILNIVNIFIISLIIYYLGFSKNITVIIGLIILFLITISRNWILNTTEEEKF